MRAMTWSAIAAVRAGLSANSSVLVRVSVTLTSGPSCCPFSSRSFKAEAASGPARVVTSTPNAACPHRHSKSMVSFPIRSRHAYGLRRVALQGKCPYGVTGLQVTVHLGLVGSEVGIMPSGDLRRSLRTLIWRMVTFTMPPVPSWGLARV